MGDPMTKSVYNTMTPRGQCTFRDPKTGARCILNAWKNGADFCITHDIAETLRTSAQMGASRARDGVAHASHDRLVSKAKTDQRLQHG
jgi:hypothetical protein